MLVWARIGPEKVFFQVTSGVTREETLETDRNGYQVAEASQLGVLRDKVGFEKYAWLPSMNTPVFAEPPSFGGSLETVQDGDFAYGLIPGSRIRLGGPFLDTLDHHTAILGITGSGKTELAFDLIRHAVGGKVKTICIDLTARYRGRLEDLNPAELSISDELAGELGQKLFDIETGAYGGFEEKKVLKVRRY